VIDVLIFGAYLALIVAFLLALKILFGVRLSILALLRELRLLLKIEVTPESLNALLMIIVLLISVLMIAASMMEGGRRFVQYLFAENPSTGPQVPPFLLFILLLALFLISMICSQVFCLRHRKILTKTRQSRRSEH
jgi:hypothetical protein